MGGYIMLGGSKNFVQPSDGIYSADKPVAKVLWRYNGSLYCWGIWLGLGS